MKTILTAVALAAALTVTAVAATPGKLSLRKGDAGSFLVDASGRTLYLFEKDKKGKSACSGACARNWPPALTSSKPSAGKGVSASKIGSIKRADGKRQITQLSSALIEIRGVPCVLTVAHDVTERRHAEDAAEKSRQQLRALASRQQAVREEAREHNAPDRQV